MKMAKRKILLIGWDAADWKIINPLIDAGEMPALEGLINEGVMGNLATLEPSFSPMLWTSIATGKRAYKHGVLGFIEPDATGVKVRPVSSVSRKVKAIWNILMQEDYKVHTVGWWPSHPAEPLNGISISNAYQKATKPYGKNWPMSSGTVHPKKQQKWFADLRVHPGELTRAHVLPFIPHGARIDQEKDKRISSFAKILAETATINSAATWVLENEEWDFMGVYFDGIDHFCHAFMNYHPPRMKGVSEDFFENYKDVVNGAYKFHDMMLERQLKLAGPDATVILISDHGFHSDHLRPKYLSDEPAAPAQQHRPYGIICIKGPGIKKDERIYGAKLLDITPTILTLCDLPVARDMDGKPLVQAFEKTPEIKLIESWENVDGECGMHPPGKLEDPYDSSEEMARLVELGYIEEPDADDMKNVEKARLESKYNLARAYMGGKKYGEALPVLKEIYTKNTDQSRFALRLATCYFHLGENEKCTELIAEFGSHLRSILSEKKGSPRKELKTEGIDEETLITLKEEENKDKVRILNTISDLMSLELLEANVFLRKNEPDRALKIFQRLMRAHPGSKRIRLSLGNAYLILGRWEDAKASFEKALAIDPEESTTLHGLAICELRLGNYYESIEKSLESIGLLYHAPKAHYHLGEALFHIEEYERAAEAFEVSLSMNSAFGQARNWLVTIYEEKLDMPEKAQKHKDFFLEESVSKKEAEHEMVSDSAIGQPKHKMLKDPVYVVSGLPRSGTSMMMQMLQQGGLEIYTDQERKPDDSNPKGYFEHEAVKRLARDARWVGHAKSKVMKVIANLLFHLPAKHNYKIIFMLRHMDEVINSQQQMLLRNGNKSAKNYPMNLAVSYRNTLTKAGNWARESHNVDLLYVEHKDVIHNPEKEAKRVAEFLGVEMDVAKMAGVVDKNLYRAKLEKAKELN